MYCSRAYVHVHATQQATKEMNIENFWFSNNNLNPNCVGGNRCWWIIKSTITFVTLKKWNFGHLSQLIHINLIDLKTTQPNQTKWFDQYGCCVIWLCAHLYKLAAASWCTVLFSIEKQQKIQMNGYSFVRIKRLCYCESNWLSVVIVHSSWSVNGGY